MFNWEGKTKDKSNLTTPHDVPASNFIDRLAKYLRENVDEVQPLPWATFAKTGMHVEKQTAHCVDNRKLVVHITVSH